MHYITGLVRRCADDYNMICDGDIIAVGVSGGKDSLTLLCALNSLRSYHHKKFDIHAVSVSMDRADDFSEIGRFCESLGVKFTLHQTEIRKLIFEDRQEKNPCSLCAKMRRGVIHGMINEMGIKKIALGHHYDDAVETFLMSLMYEGRINCFMPVTYMSNSRVTQIRPLLYVSEDKIKSFAARASLPVMPRTCPLDGYSKREEIKKLIAELGAKTPDIKQKIFGSMQRYPLTGWKPEEYSRRPLP
jgi:tRNA 2-thiocytidine biosynthesis protein TtcA